MDPPNNWWNVTKRNNKQSDANKEHRFSKLQIGQPQALSIQQNSGDSYSPDNPNCPAMTMKCIILQKNDKGFGLTVSGDNPVYVQSVKEDGAAHKAGVHEGDRIIKVNGTNVTEYGHIAVVKLIKADSYVALTLLGVPGGANPGQYGGDNSSSSHSSASDHSKNSSSKSYSQQQNPFYDQKVETIKRMLEQSRAEYEKIKDEYAKMPSDKLLQDLRVSQSMKQDLEKKLWRANSTAVAATPLPRYITDIDESIGFEEKSDLRSKRGISSSAMDLVSYLFIIIA